jgi:Protein of unknown function (DUF1398)
MNNAVIQELIEKALARKITFPEILAALTKEGVESYHVDFLRNQVRYYTKSGESLAVNASFTRAWPESFPRRSSTLLIAECRPVRHLTPISSARAQPPDAPVTSSISMASWSAISGATVANTFRISPAPDELGFGRQLSRSQGRIKHEENWSILYQVR